MFSRIINEMSSQTLYTSFQTIIQFGRGQVADLRNELRNDVKYGLLDRISSRPRPRNIGENC